MKYYTNAQKTPLNKWYVETDIIAGGYAGEGHTLKEVDYFTASTLYDPNKWTLIALFQGRGLYHRAVVCFDTKEEAEAAAEPLAELLMIRFTGGS